MISQFYEAVLKGLSNNEKYLSSKYLFDANGCRIFQEIMQMPEYYLTDSEFEILSLQAEFIIESLNFKTPFNIIEIGAGDGLKTFKLLEYLINKNIDFYYIPIDTSLEAMTKLTSKLKERLPSLKIQPRIGNYYEVLEKENLLTKIPSLLLFLGSNIGNYTLDGAVSLLRLLHNYMKDNDKLLLGIDLKKNPLVVQQAYFDKYGITKKININLLIRINKELGGDFKVDDFDFYCHYNPISGAVKSYLVSLREQQVHIEKLNTTFSFGYNELISTGVSKKYDFKEIEILGNQSGFKIVKHFLDCKHYFTDILLVK